MNDDKEFPDMVDQRIYGDNLHDRNVLDRSRSKIGKIADVYYDNDTGKPEWLLVQTGLFGMRETFVPVALVRSEGEDLLVDRDKDFVNDAPNVGGDDELSQSDEQALAQYYGLRYSQRHSDSGLPEGGGTQRPGGHGRDTAMTRSEEELDVGTTKRPSELVRLKKRVVTEAQQVTVPVQHEEVRIEREPITDANREQALDGPEITESEHEMTLSDEEVVVSKRTVPKERVRLDKDVVTDQETVREDIRKERIDVEREPRNA